MEMYFITVTDYRILRSAHTIFHENILKYYEPIARTYNFEKDRELVTYKTRTIFSYSDYLFQL